MKTVDRYLLRQGLSGAVASLLVLLAVVLGLFFAELLGDAAGGEIPGRILFRLLGLRVAEALVLVGPLALMAGLLLALGRLGQQSELTVLRAAGMPPARLLRPLLVLVLIWAAGMALAGAWAAPASQRATVELMNDVAREAVLTGLTPGRFQRMNQGQLVIYVERVDAGSGDLLDVLIQRELGGRREVTTAVRGQFWIDPATGDRFLSLLDGFQVDHTPGMPDLRRLSFGRYDVRLPPPPRVAGASEQALMSMTELGTARSAAARIELQSRFAPVFSSIFLGLLAVPLAMGGVRRSHHGRIVLALVFYLCYSNLLNLGLMGMEQGRVPVGVGLWPIHGLVLAILLLYWRRLYRTW